jgi:hypothetical protein
MGDLEGTTGDPNASIMAQQMLKTLETISSDFKTHHITSVGKG